MVSSCPILPIEHGVGGGSTNPYLRVGHERWLLGMTFDAWSRQYKHLSVMFVHSYCVVFHSYRLNQTCNNPINKSSG